MRVLGQEKLTRDRDGGVVDLRAPARKAAVEALAEQDSPAARDGLVRALRDPEESVRTAAVQALSLRGYTGAGDPLVAVVTGWTAEENAGLRRHALETLASYTDPELPRAVAAALLSRPTNLGDADAKVLRRLVEAGGPDAARTTVDDLVDRLREGPDSPRVRRLLAWLEPNSVGPLVDLLHEPRVQRGAALTLGTIHDSRATEPLCYVLLEGTNPASRAAAAWALGEIRDPAAVKTLLRASSDQDYSVRAETIAAFDKLGNVAVAVAMSIHVRAALEDGAERPAPTLAPDGDAGELPRSRPEPAKPTVADRALPALRRLLGQPPR